MSDVDVGQPGAVPNGQGHGTCMASIAMGSKDGVARKVSLTVLRSDVFGDNTDNSVETWIDALAKVYEDVIKSNAESKAVVSMSFGVGQTATKTSWRATHQQRRHHFWRLMLGISHC